MENLLNRLIRTEAYPNKLQRERAILVMLFSIILIVVYLIYAFFINQWLVPGTEGDVTTLVGVLAVRPEAWLYLLLPLGIGLVGVFSTWRGHANAVAFIPPLVLYLLTALPAFISPQPAGVLTPTQVVNLTAFILMCGLLYYQTGLLVSVSVAIATLLIRPGTDVDGATLVTTILQFLGVAAIVYLFLRYASISQAQGSLSATQERLKLADINTRITRKASQRVALDDTMNTALKLILENYPQFYHAQLFLVHQDEVQAQLVASTGAVGQQLLERKHKLAVGSLSVIGQTTLKGQPIIAQARLRDGIHRPNDLLPDTRLEAAFPLRIGTHIIGALDLQSRELETLADDDIATFQSLADSLSLVIDNIRQFETAQKQVQEKQQLAERARVQLEDIERLNKRLVGRAWSEYLQDRYDMIGYNIDFEQDATEQDARWTATMAEAAQHNATTNQGNVVAVPLRVRGQVIGAMEFELDGDGQLAPEDLDMLLEVGERFGLAAENIRLVEESQSAAQRETLINEISSRFQATNNVEATLTEAARSLHETLKANKIVIQMGTPNTQNGNGANNP